MRNTYTGYCMYHLGKIYYTLDQPSERETNKFKEELRCSKHFSLSKKHCPYLNILNEQDFLDIM